MIRIKLNPLPPTMRERKRYIIFNIYSESPKNLGEIVNAIWNSLLGFLGENEVSKANIWIVSTLFNQELQRAVMKLNHNMVDKVRAALALIKEINGERATLSVVGIAGTMRGAKRKYFEVNNS